MSRLISWLFTGGLIPIALLLCGGFFWFYLRGMPFLSPRGMLRALRHTSSEGVSPFRAVTLALAGTLGVGNVVGVASALLMGGAGAILWMWVSALLAMVLKYAEILLAVLHRQTDRDGAHHGGAVYYIRTCLRERRHPKLGSILSLIFSLLMILNALCMGCIVQVNAVAGVFTGALGLPSLCVGFLLLILTVPVILRGTKGISALTEYLVPIMSLGYAVLSVAVLLIRREAILPTLGRILSEACAPMSAPGGVTGFLTARALRVGTMRGLLSNEAGCGTAPTAHACANTDTPAAQGVWGIFEVFVDTIVLCTMTALVILIAFPDLHDFGLSPVMMTVRAYSTVLGKWAEYFFAAAVFCFGYATLICWAGYGTESIRAISPKKQYHRFYLSAFCICIPLGSIIAPNAVWDLSDFAIASLTSINLTVLLLMRKTIRQETQRFFARRPPKKVGNIAALDNSSKT